jgi:SAM-dependent methyltransferase
MMIKLNIGCGANVFPAPWCNVDRTDLEKDYFAHIRGLDADRLDASWSEEQKNHVRWLNDGSLRFEQRDLRQGFPDYADGTVDAIYLGQVVEHLNPLHELPKLLTECHRMLRKGGAVRITTPDLDNILMAYADNRMEDFCAEQPAFYAKASSAARLGFLLFGAGGAGCTRENYEGHMHCWTIKDLSSLLRECGFATVDHAPLPSVPFTSCKDFGMSHSMGLEARK